jgi:hypothetical protein
MAGTYVYENRFDVPPDYAAKWLTDFRPDDGQRWFEHKGAAAAVTRKGNEIWQEGPHPMGWAKGVVVIDSPTAWHATTEFFKTKGGPSTGRGTVKETVRAEGKGTVHRAEITFDPLTLGMKLMFPIMGKAMMDKSLKAGFARMKQDMEASYKAGKPPTA